ncbi:MAG: ATP-binding protein [Eubacterium sp.]|nr:ATP-binding protein [Eubacterium sp.]
MEVNAFIAAALQAPPQETLQTLSGHEKLKQILEGLLPDKEMDRIFLLPRRCCICLTGDAGSGKRTLAEAFAGTAVQQGYTYYRVDSGLMQEVKAEQRKQCISALLQKSRKERCIFLMEPAGSQEMIRAVAGAYRMLPEQADGIVVLIEENLEEAGAGQIPDLMQFVIELPDQEEREAFFENDRNRLPRKTNAMGEKVPSYRALAEDSEGLTYRELTQVIRVIRLQLKARAQAEYGTDTAALLASLRDGRFYYTEMQFAEAVAQIRKLRRSAAPQSQADGRSRQTTQPPVSVTQPLIENKNWLVQELKGVYPGILQGETPGTASNRGLTEDEIALNELLGELDIPNDPR